MDRYDNNLGFQEFVKQQNSKSENGFSGCTVILIVAFITFFILLFLWSCISGTYSTSKAKEKLAEREPDPEYVAWLYIHDNHPYAKLQKTKVISKDELKTVVEGEFKLRNAFGQWAHHSFRITVTDGLVTGCDTKFLGFK